MLPKVTVALLASDLPYYTAGELLKVARQMLQQPLQESRKDDLHVTMWFQQTPRPDREIHRNLLGNTTPHISLFKEEHQTWKDFGRIAQIRQRTADWEETDQKKWVSRSTGLPSVEVFGHASVKAEVHLRSQEPE